MQIFPFFSKEIQCMTLRRLVLLFLAQNKPNILVYNLVYLVYILKVYSILNKNSYHNTDGKAKYPVQQWILNSIKCKLQTLMTD